MFSNHHAPPLIAFGIALLFGCGAAPLALAQGSGLRGGKVAADASAGAAVPALGAPAVAPFSPPLLAGPPGDLPEGFWSWPANEQLKWLQTRQAVLDLVKKLFVTQRDIREASRAGPTNVGPAASGAATPVMVQPTKQSADLSLSLPMVQRIYLRDGVAYADLLVRAQGMRTVKAGASLPDGMRVAEINRDDVVVEVDAHRVPLPGATATASDVRVSPAQPTIAAPPVQAPASRMIGASVGDLPLPAEPGAPPSHSGMR